MLELPLGQHRFVLALGQAWSDQAGVVGPAVALAAEAASPFAYMLAAGC
jgi:hypothetical protein